MNGGFIDGNTAAGLRKTLTDEFSSLYVLNLRGNTRTSGEQARREGGQIFGSGSRATIAILVLVKNPTSGLHGRLYYRDIGDYQDRSQKLASLSEYRTLGGVKWSTLVPNEDGDWLDQRDSSFMGFTPIGEKHDLAGAESTLFSTYSRGLETGRDAWVYSSSKTQLIANVRKTIDAFNELVDQYELYTREHPTENKKDVAARFWDPDSTRISWTLSLKNRLIARRKIQFDEDAITVGAYRPFQKQWVYFDRSLNHIVGLTPKMFPTKDTINFGFYLNGIHAFSTSAILMVHELPCLDLYGKGGQFFPRYTFQSPSTEPQLFDEGQLRRTQENVTSRALEMFRARYGASVTTDDIFYFTYGLLHSPRYLDTYSSDLRKMLPRIPMLSNPADFVAFATAGRELSALHLGYEAVEPYPLVEKRAAGASLLVSKMKFAGKAGAWDKSTVLYNDSITLTGIPDEAHEYMLGSRSALEWVIERYRIKTDKDSGIVNDPNDWGREHGDPEYILNLVKRIVTVSVETVRIVGGLPELVSAD